MTTLVSDLIGLSEIADMYRVTKNVAKGWTLKSDFPKEKHRLAMGPMWDRGEVQQWYRPSNFPAEHALYCAHCQSQRLSIVACDSRKRPSAIADEWGDPVGDEHFEVQMAARCHTCDDMTTISIQTDDRAKIVTYKQGVSPIEEILQ